MLFKYTTVNDAGEKSDGTIDAFNADVAIVSLQRRGLIVVSIEPAKKSSLLNFNITIFERVTNREIVILSRQIATLFGAQVSAVRIFRMLAQEAESPLLQRTLTEVVDDLQGGNMISKALSKHPKVFSPFYVNMVRSGEESGKLDRTFNYLADYIDRTYEVTMKARNALIYPAFVMTVFVVVMILMLVLVIPNITKILVEAGGEIPIYTKIVIGISEFFINYGIFLAIALLVGGTALWRYSLKGRGKLAKDQMKLLIPYIGNLYRKLYLSRLSDNLSTMILSGISMVRSIEITATTIDNVVFENILNEAAQSIKAGRSVSEVLSKYDEIPSILTQMIKIGEETGELGVILDTLSKFYRREVLEAVDTLVRLIEPAMIVLLALGVGVLLTSVLMPIYNIAGAV